MSIKELNAYCNEKDLYIITHRGILCGFSGKDWKSVFVKRLK